jgi:uncharacterized protein
VSGLEQPAPSVVNNAGAGRFELHADGQVAVLDYVVAGGRLRLMHTEVPPELRGRKYAEVLARAGLEYARSARLRVVPFCPFVRAFLLRHPEYEPVLDDHWKAVIAGNRPGS